VLDRELKRLRKDADAEKSSIRIEADAGVAQGFVHHVYDVCKNAVFRRFSSSHPHAEARSNMGMRKHQSHGPGGVNLG